MFETHRTAGIPLRLAKASSAFVALLLCLSAAPSPAFARLGDAFGDRISNPRSANF